MHVEQLQDSSDSFIWNSIAWEIGLGSQGFSSLIT